MSVALFAATGIDRRYKICLICGLMRTFGGFRSGEEFFYGEVRGEDVHVLAKPYWITITPTGDMRKLADLHVDVPVAPSKVIAIGLNYSDHIAHSVDLVQGAQLAPAARRHDRNRISRTSNGF